MPLTAGTRLGPYEIVAPIGAGGMGEVYKARDTRLERTVAIKVLPAALAADPEFKARFEREAKSISALNHPHICTLHDVGNENGIEFLVMEHLEGETLAARLAKGALPSDQALEYALQIADALDKAHRQGIVHRDLKPANVFLVKGAGASGPGICKLLDFGLAKVGAAAPPGTIETKLVTSPPKGIAQGGTPGQPTAPFGTAQGGPLTSQGSILGTFQYMAPEQIEGQDADARTDIWAFGCVLYEMLTGRRAFDGKSQASLIASILERQPTPMAELQPMTPPALGRLVRTCLEKNPDNRFHTAHDLWLHLQWIEEGGSAAGLPAPVIAGRKRRDRVLFAGVAVVVAALAAVGAWVLKPAPFVTNVVARFSYPLADAVSFTRTGRRFVAVSPDGTKIAFIANEQIYLRHIHELEAQPIRGTAVDPLDLAFSPDSQSIVFFAAETIRGDLSTASLKRIAVAGGKAVTLCPAGPPYGVRWEGDRIVFSLGTSILAVPDAGGTPETLVSVKPDSGEVLAQPQLLNDGRDLLYTVRPRSASFNDAEIVVQRLPGGERRVLARGAMDGRVVASSPGQQPRAGAHLLYVRDGTLFAQALNLATVEPAGGPVPVVEGVRQTANSGAGQFGVSETGTLIFTPGASGALSELVWVDRQGREEPIGAPPHEYAYPRLSPDGTKIAVAAADGDADIWVWDGARKTLSLLTRGPDADNYPIWTPDSRAVIFRSNPNGQTDLFRRAADGTGTLERLTNTPEAESAQAVLRDGRLLLRLAPNDLGSGPLHVLPLIGEAKTQPVIPTATAAQTNGDVSPDGRWIAYQSSEASTSDEIYVRPFPNTDGGRWLISSGGGLKPVWTRSGRELIYQTRGPDRLVVVPVQPVLPGAPFAYGTPTPLPFDATLYGLGFAGRGYDVSPDGQRFLVPKLQGDATGRQSITVVTHWFEELTARARGK